MSTLSACLITRNEAKNLPQALTSLRGVASELVVVDTGSTDSTKAVARQYGARVRDFPWRDDFAAARNQALDQATGDWVLVIDADEELEPQAATALPQLLKQDESEGFWFTVASLSRENGAPGEALCHASLRLFRRRPAYRYQGRIHEQVLPSILAANPGARLAESGLRLLHHGYQASGPGYRAKLQRNLALLEATLKEDPQNPFWLFNLGVTQYQLGNRPQAAHQWQQALAATGPDAPYHAATYRYLGQVLGEMGRCPRGLVVLDQGTDLYPDYTDLWYLAGWLNLLQNRHAAAQAALAHCLELGEAPSRYVTNLGVGGHRALHLWGRSLRMEGRYQEAMRAFTLALQRQPEYYPSLLGLSTALGQAGLSALEVEAYLDRYFSLAPAALATVGVNLAGAGQQEAAARLWQRLKEAVGEPTSHRLWSQACLSAASDALTEAVEFLPGVPALAQARQDWQRERQRLLLYLDGG